MISPCHISDGESGVPFWINMSQDWWPMFHLLGVKHISKLYPSGNLSLEKNITGLLSGKIYRKPWFLPSNIGLSCKFSHHPILWEYQFVKDLPMVFMTTEMAMLPEGRSPPRLWASLGLCSCCCIGYTSKGWGKMKTQSKYLLYIYI